MNKTVQATIKWRRPEIEALICLLKENEILYNPDHNDYRNYDKRSDSVRLISLELQKINALMTEDAIRTKIHTLRSQYQKEQRKLESFMVRGQPYIPSLWCFNELTFLKPHKSSAKPQEIPAEIIDVIGEAAAETKPLSTALWNRFLTTELICQFRAQPILYDIKHVDHKNAKKRAESLQQMLLELRKLDVGVTNEAIRAKIHTLRSQYQKEQQKIQSCKSKGETYVSTLWCFNDLEFLTCDGANSSEAEVRPTLPAIQWKRLLTKKLISLFSENAILYDTTHADYENPLERSVALHKIWLEISELDGSLTIAAVGKKIYSLRAQFEREYRYVKTCDEDNSTGHNKEVYIPSLWCYNQLKFLRPHCENSLREVHNADDTNSLPEFSTESPVDTTCEIELCRLCTNFTESANSPNIFKQHQARLLDQIEELTGLELKNTRDLPELVCNVCVEQIMLAHKFRERCIQAQLHFNTAEYRNKLGARTEFNTINEAEPEIVGDADELIVPYTVLSQEPSRNSAEEDENDSNDNGSSSSSMNSDGTDEDMRLLIKPENTIDPDEIPTMFVKRSNRNTEHKDHLVTHNGERPFGCEICNISFRKVKTLKQHYRSMSHKSNAKKPPHERLVTHTADLPFGCETCNVSFRLANTLKRHRSSMSHKNNVKKQQSNIELSEASNDPIRSTNSAENDEDNESNENMSKHMAKNSRVADDAMRLVVEPDISIVADEIPTAELNENKVRPQFVTNTGRVCDQCGKYFKCGGNSFKDHMRRHVGVKEFRCEFCSKMFMTKPQLRLHRHQHTGETPYSCRYCDKHFNSPTTKLLHERRIHTHERPYVCNVCGKRFINNSQHRQHVVIHTGDRPFGCILCNVTFRLAKTLKQHQRSVSHKTNVEKQIQL